ncbi:MAG: hypothetical protein H5U40_03450, partial [Polyangiaceae bacterium]|nr:hypothetical protein [Polyangiaceae bacterium]
LVTLTGGTLEVRVPEGKGPEAILEVALASGHQIRHLCPLSQTLERAFMTTLERAGLAAAEGA